MRIGIYGGTFDPIHFGHLLLAESAREALRLDRVLFVPARVPPHKQWKVLASEADRVAMLRLAIRGNRGFHIETFELEQPEVSYTVHTAEYLHGKYPKAKIYLLMGEDMLRTFPDWYEPERICELVTPAVIGRAGHEIRGLGFLRKVTSREKLEEIRASRVPMPAVDFSSTAIREAVSAGKSIRYQTPSRVVTYINSHQLYRETE